MIINGATNGIPGAQTVVTPYVVPPIQLVGNGHWNWLVRPGGSRGTGAPSAGFCTVYPVCFANRATIDAVAYEITAANATAVNEWAVWADGGDFYPIGKPIVFFGIGDASTTGVKTLTAQWSVEPGVLYWLGFQNLTAASTYRRSDASSTTSYATSKTVTDLIQATNRVAYGFQTVGSSSLQSFSIPSTARNPGNGQDWFPLIAARCQ